MANLHTFSLSPAALTQIAKARWFQDKSLQIQEHAFIDLIRLTDTTFLALVEIKTQAQQNIYLLFLQRAQNSSQELDLVRAEEDFIETLFTGFKQNKMASKYGTLEYFGQEQVVNLRVKALSHDHTNSVFFKEPKTLLKFYRKLEAGEHPEEHLLKLLEGTDLAPKYKGKLIWHLKEQQKSFLIALEQEHLEHKGNMWDWLIEQFKTFTGSEPTLQETLEQTFQALGVTLAHFHNRIYELSVFDPEAGATFKAGSVSEEDILKLETDIQNLYEGSQAVLSKNFTWELQEYIGAQEKALGFLGVKFKQHGDFHLGQILRTGSGFKIIDFEGQPVNLLRQRWELRSPLQDLASLLRSIQYAEAILGKDNRPEQKRLLVKASTKMQEGFQLAYEHMAHFPLPKPLQPFLNLELLLKTLQELDYELKTRPDMAWICEEALKKQICFQ
jgi:predicted trehalose synthase